MKRLIETAHAAFISTLPVLVIISFSVVASLMLNPVDNYHEQPKELKNHKGLQDNLRLKELQL